MFIDSHCHLDKIDLSPYDNDFDAMLAAARDASVDTLLSVSVDMGSFPALYERIAAREGIFVSVGVHPLHSDEGLVEVSRLVEEAARAKVVAIGETGLDYYYDADSAELQQESFKRHLEAAAQAQLPVIVHTRDARDDTLRLIDAHGDSRSAGVLHCFTESLEMAMAAIEMNYFISFSGIVTFRNAEALRQVVREVPLERILIETDAPYLAPVPYRGKKNEPRYVPAVAQCIADLKGVRVEEIAERTSENFYQLFRRAAAR
ncbi:MAG: TatD family hydrolase [Oceanospirillaceae bacterium]|nr:TatD family hydrolase [Oceanospirillaceae bacterium]